MGRSCESGASESRKSGVTKPDHLVFKFQDGSTIEESLAGNMMLAKNYIANELNQRGLTIENVYK